MNLKKHMNERMRSFQEKLDRENAFHLLFTDCKSEFSYQEYRTRFLAHNSHVHVERAREAIRNVFQRQIHKIVMHESIAGGLNSKEQEFTLAAVKPGALIPVGYFQILPRVRGKKRRQIVQAKKRAFQSDDEDEKEDEEEEEEEEEEQIESGNTDTRTLSQSSDKVVDSQTFQKEQMESFKQELLLQLAELEKLKKAEADRIATIDKYRIDLEAAQTAQATLERQKLRDEETINALREWCAAASTRAEVAEALRARTDADLLRERGDQEAHSKEHERLVRENATFAANIASANSDVARIGKLNASMFAENQMLKDKLLSREQNRKDKQVYRSGTPLPADPKQSSEKIINVDVDKSDN